MSAPTLDMEIDYYSIPKVLISGGSRINIMTYETMKRLGLTNLEPILVNIGLDDQQMIKLVVILRGAKSMIFGLSFFWIMSSCTH